MTVEDVLRQIEDALDTESSWRAAVAAARPSLPVEDESNIMSAVELALRTARAYDAKKILRALQAAGDVEAGLRALRED